MARTPSLVFQASLGLNALLAAALLLCLSIGRSLGLGVTTSRSAAFSPAGVTRDVSNIRANANLKEIRGRIESVSNTKKITSSMKLVAAAKVRKAQAAVMGGRPFAENLVKTLYGVNQKVVAEDLDSALTQIRPVKNVLFLAFLETVVCVV